MSKKFQQNFNLSLHKQLIDIKAKIESAIRKMINNKLTVIKFNGEFVTKHELYELLDIANKSNNHNVINSRIMTINNSIRIINITSSEKVLYLSYQTIKGQLNESYIHFNLN